MKDACVFVYMYSHVSKSARMIVLIDMTASSSVRVTYSARGIQEIMSCFEVVTYELSRERVRPKSDADATTGRSPDSF